MTVSLNELSHIADIVLQIDATTLAGILILLTIRSFVFERENKLMKHLPKPSWVVGLVGTPFAFSAIVVLFYMMNPLTPAPPLPTPDSIEIASDNQQIFFATGFTVIGFLYMVWVFFKINMREKKKSKNIERNWFEQRIYKFKMKRKRKKLRKEMGKIQERCMKFFEKL